MPIDGATHRFNGTDVGDQFPEHPFKGLHCRINERFESDGLYDCYVNLDLGEAVDRFARCQGISKVQALGVMMQNHLVREEKWAECEANETLELELLSATAAGVEFELV